MLGSTLFISRVEHDLSLVRCAYSFADIMFNTRNKYAISAQPCIILYLAQWFRANTLFCAKAERLLKLLSKITRSVCLRDIVI